MHSSTIDLPLHKILPEFVAFVTLNLSAVQKHEQRQIQKF